MRDEGHSGSQRSGTDRHSEYRGAAQAELSSYTIEDSGFQRGQVIALGGLALLTPPWSLTLD